MDIMTGRPAVRIPVMPDSSCHSADFYRMRLKADTQKVRVS